MSLISKDNCRLFGIQPYNSFSKDNLVSYHHFLVVSSIQNKFRLSSFYGFFNLSVIFYITMKTAYLKFRFLELLILSNNPANGLILALYIAVSTGCIFVVIGKDNQNSSSSCRGSFIDIWELVIVNLSIVKLFVK